MIMMPIALKTLKESQTQEREVLGDSFSAPSTFDPIVPTFFSPKPKKLFPAHTVAGPSFSKGRNGGGGFQQSQSFFFFCFFSVHSCMYVYNAQLCVSRSYSPINQVYFPRFLPFPSCDNLQH